LSIKVWFDISKGNNKGNNEGYSNNSEDKGTKTDNDIANNDLTNNNPQLGNDVSGNSDDAASVGNNNTSDAGDSGNIATSSNGAANSSSTNTASSDKPLEVLFETRVYFEFNKSDLLFTEKIRVDAFVKLLGKYPNSEIFITGHTDSVGSESYNYILSVKRAEFVKNLLVAGGLKNNYRVFGFGENAPFIKEDNELSQAANRQVMLRVYK